MDIATLLRESPDCVISNSPVSHTTFEPRAVAHQGDIILVAIGTLPKSAKPRADRQLAEGSSQGSRHILSEGKCYDAAPGDVCALIRKATKKNIEERYIGPVFEGPCTLTHPEHGHHVFPDGAIVAVVYQRNLDAEGRAQRSLD